MNEKDDSILFEFCLQQVNWEPDLVRRARIYRALARHTEKPDEAAQLQALADDLEEANHRANQLHFQFKGRVG